MVVLYYCTPFSPILQNKLIHSHTHNHVTLHIRWPWNVSLHTQGLFSTYSNTTTNTDFFKTSFELLIIAYNQHSAENWPMYLLKEILRIKTHHFQIMNYERRYHSHVQHNAFAHDMNLAHIYLHQHFFFIKMSKAALFLHNSQSSSQFFSSNNSFRREYHHYNCSKFNLKQYVNVALMCSTRFISKLSILVANFFGKHFRNKLNKEIVFCFMYNHIGDHLVHVFVVYDGYKAGS